MRCFTCGREIDESVGKCLHCEENGADAVRVMTPEEKAGYQGLTINVGGERAEERQQSRQTYQGSSQRRVYVKNISSVRSSNWMTKIAIFVVLAVIASFLLFVALPVALIGIGVGIVVWLVLSFLRG